MLSKKRLKLLKKNCIVINTSRGEIIDEQALAGLLFNKKIGGAGLDVFEHEPQITPKLLESTGKVKLISLDQPSRPFFEVAFAMW